MGIQWTKPYYGIQHLKGHKLLDDRSRQAQVTVNNLGSCATLHCWKRPPDYPGLKSTGPVRVFDTVALAQAEGERWFLALL